MARVIVALDKPSRAEALEVVDALGGAGDFYKVGLELYTRAGPEVVRDLRSRGKEVFLDLKLHDIPNTVSRAVHAAADLEVALLTVHAAGGRTMLEAARDAAGARTRLLAVTVLTSLAPDEMEDVWGREILSVRDEVGRLAALAAETGVDGAVASAREASWIRQSVGAGLLIATPGIRPADSDPGDQKRVATPGEAVEAGADYLVVGRPVTLARDPAAALEGILAEVAAAGT